MLAEQPRDEPIYNPFVLGYRRYRPGWKLKQNVREKFSCLYQITLKLQFVFVHLLATHRTNRQNLRIHQFFFENCHVPVRIRLEL